MLNKALENAKMCHHEVRKQAQKDARERKEPLHVSIVNNQVCRERANNKVFSGGSEMPLKVVGLRPQNRS